MDSKMEISYSPLEEEQLLDPQELQLRKTEAVWRRRFLILLGVCLSGLLVIGICSVKIKHSFSCRHEPSNVVQPYSPADGHMKYENRYLTRDPETHTFMGKARPELDEAWHKLLEGTLIRVSKEELLKAGNATSIVHKDGGYVAGLGIAHSLHCLKRLKQYMNKDYYYSQKPQEWEELEFHADHCLEGLRQAVMCHADLSVYTLEWTKHSKFKPTVRVPQAHVCVDWTQLHGWMMGRASKAEDMMPAPPELYDN